MTLASYIEIRDWLEGFIPQTYTKGELGLTRIENLLAKLGNPEKRFKSIHIGGTSGKGTTAFYIARLLAYSGPASSFPPASARSKQGKNHSQINNVELRAVESPSRTVTRKLKVGLHISPHLVDIRERMQILQTQDARRKTQNVRDNLMTMRRFVGLANKIKPVVDEIIAKQPEKTPSYFEILVAMSFLYFAQEKVDWVAVEVGLGGRLDATNVLIPEISVITNVGLDHTELLGDTVGKIAKEKAGIIKTHVPVVTAATGVALKVIENAAKSKDSQLIKLNTRTGKILPKVDTFYDIAKLIDVFRYNLYSAKRECLFLAISTILSLGIRVDKKMVKTVLPATFPGRFEEIDSTPPRLRGTSASVILDGAHNPDKILSLINFVRKLETRNSKLETILVVAFKQGKSWKAMMDLLIKNLPVIKITATEYQAVTDTGRGSAVGADEIARYLSKDKRLTTKVKVIRNSQEAVFEALRLRSGSSTLVLVTGSLYLVGEARTVWKLPEF